MSRQQLAEGLLELWDEYIHDGPKIFQPTMTDFMHWLRDHGMTETEQEVKPTRTWPFVAPLSPETRDKVMQLRGEDVNDEGNVEASVAKPMLGKTITRSDINKIRQLYEKGYALARIRQELGLNVTLGRLQTVVNKPW